MTLDEAIAIRQLGAKAQPHMTREAARVIRCAGAMALATRGRVEFYPLSKLEIDRINVILVCRLALACGMLDAWRTAG